MTEPEKMRAEFYEWVNDRGCDTDGAWSAWQACWNLWSGMAQPVAWQYRKRDVYYEGERPSWSQWWNCTKQEAAKFGQQANVEVRALVAAAPR